MWTIALEPGTLAYAAGACYILGLITINQVLLRLLVLLGTALYVVYYAIVADSPLVEAIYVSLLIGVANILGLANLWLRHSRLVVPRGYHEIYKSFPPIPPGDFRTLMKLAQRQTVEDERVLTHEGQPGGRLFYVISGTTRVRKGDAEFALQPGLFLGEIAFLTGQPSSATAWLGPGSELLEWDFDVLNRRCTRSTRFKLALEAAISVDLAGKVARAVGPHAVRYPIGAPQASWDRVG